MLQGKKILIVSPQPWGKIRISKHHYAVELAKAGNTVYFLNPPINGNRFEVIPIAEEERLFQVNFSTWMPYRLKFHARKLFDMGMKRQMGWISKKLGGIDVLWCFDPNVYTNLKWFGASLTIFHPVDPVNRQEQIDVAQTADILFTVSEKIRSSFSGIDVPSYFVHHGLARAFESESRKHLAAIKQPGNGGNVKVGYVGNLLRPVIDRPLIKSIIEEFNAVEFHFYGPYEMKGNNMGGGTDAETIEFINWLKSQDHVYLHGTRHPDELAVEMQQYDLFFLTYQFVKGQSDRSNSHKLLEYLSTGKAIISSRFLTFEVNRDIMYMPEDDDDQKMIPLMGKVINDLDHFNGPELVKKRLEFALDNTYARQLERIDECLERHFSS